MARSIDNSVVVITGASSGIGRAAALAFAKRGARLVLAARREHLLIELLSECEHLGASAIAVPTDMSDERAVKQLAQRALNAYGRIDTWINNHGVTLFATTQEAPIAEYRKVLEVNFFGTVYGARAVLPIFRQQGSGVLINTGSILSRVGTPYQSAYVASKHAIRGLGISLRQELTLAGAKDVHVCTVMPASIDTPFYQHGANHTGRKAQAMPPVYHPDRVAQAYLRLAQRPRPETFVGNAARLFIIQHLFFPRTSETQLAHLSDRLLLSQDEPQPATTGALFTPMRKAHGITGGWQSPADPLLRKAGGALLLAAPLALAWRWLRGRAAASRPQLEADSRTTPEHGSQLGQRPIS